MQDYAIDFADENHPIKAFQCCCGSEFCRDMNGKGTSILSCSLKQLSIFFRWFWIFAVPFGIFHQASLVYPRQKDFFLLEK